MNFRYDHLLTPLDEAGLSSNSQSQSLCDVIEGQHKHQRAPIGQAVFAFQNLYTQNFCAAKELERIDQINQTVCKTDDNEAQLFSLEYDSFPAKRSSEQSFAKPIQFSNKNLYSTPLKEQRKTIAQKERPINITTPMALNEHKYSKGNNYKKLQQPTVISKPSVSFQSSEKTTQPLNHLFNQNPVTNAVKFDRSTSFYGKPLMNSNRKTSNDWFEPSRRSQQAEFTTTSQMDSDPSSLQEGFIPSQSGWNSGFYCFK